MSYVTMPEKLSFLPLLSQVHVQPDQPMFQISLNTQSMGNELMKRKAEEMME